MRGIKKSIKRGMGRSVRRGVRRRGRRAARRNIGAFLILMAIVAIGLFVWDYLSPVELERATVHRIIDGDTIDVIMVNGDIERIRFIGIDAPEMGRFGAEVGAEPGAIEARDFVAATIPVGSTVWLEGDRSLNPLDRRDRDPFDRLRRYIWVTRPTDPNNQEQRQRYVLNNIMLEAGHATLWGR